MSGLNVRLASKVLNWFTSYLVGRIFSVNISSSFSWSAPISCDVSLGSILGHLLFSLYTLPVGSSFQKYCVPYHCYADDTQFYLPVKSDKICTISNLLKCLNDANVGWQITSFNWMKIKQESLFLVPHPFSRLCSLSTNQNDCQKSWCHFCHTVKFWEAD